MKQEISIIYDDQEPNKVLIKSSLSPQDPWGDLGLLIEGMGVLVSACISNGITEHNNQPLNEYLKDYVDKVCYDYGSKHTTN